MKVNKSDIIEKDGKFYIRNPRATAFQKAVKNALDDGVWAHSEPRMIELYKAGVYMSFRSETGMLSKKLKAEIVKNCAGIGATFAYDHHEDAFWGVSIQPRKKNPHAIMNPPAPWKKAFQSWAVEYSLGDGLPLSNTKAATEAIKFVEKDAGNHKICGPHDDWHSGGGNYHFAVMRDDGYWYIFSNADYLITKTRKKYKTFDAFFKEWSDDFWEAVDDNYIADWETLEKKIKQNPPESPGNYDPDWEGDQMDVNPGSERCPYEHAPSFVVAVHRVDLIDRLDDAHKQNIIDALKKRMKNTNPPMKRNPEFTGLAWVQCPNCEYEFEEEVTINVEPNW